MKTMKNIILVIIFTLALISCDNIVGLGEKLDLNGPEVNFTSPAPRKTINAAFWLKGTVSDYRSISRMIVKVEKDNEELPRQWRNTNGNWEISDNYGSSWSSFADAKWEGSNSITWSIYVDLNINGKKPEDGEYMFSVQAWDKGGISDDNSYKTLILILDTDPPKVTVFNPFLYDRSISYDPATETFDDAELESLRLLTDWRDPELIGKFQTGSFLLQWSIEDNFNIWSFDLRFYEMSELVDNKPDTPLSDNYIYRFHKNTPPAPDVPSPENYLKPNGSVTVPALEGETGSYGENGHLYKSITDKTIIRVVTLCYDAADNITQEKTLGYLIYWPQADIPWITYTGDIYPPEYYNDHPAEPGPFKTNVEDAFLFYPGTGRSIKATAFHAQGVKEIIFSLYKIDKLENTLQDCEINLLPEYDHIKKENTLRGNDTYSANFQWDFSPPPRSAFYIVEAKAFSVSGKESEVARVLFKVQDITFPDFPKPVQPPALEPFFQHIDNATNSLTISGIVSDATEIDSLCLVWINPQSKGAAAMAQLEYFRDPQYVGWMTALGLTPGGTYESEGKYDPSNPNKVWRLALGNPELNGDTQRIEYKFSRTIPLDDLNIGIGKEALKSQVFLLRASNPSPKTTIITYTPQGDESPPVIKITNVIITKNSIPTSTLTPGEFADIKKFNNGDKITINGTWKEDSVKYLDFNNYLKDNFKISINQNDLSASKLSFTGVTDSDSGEWKAEVTVGTDIPLTNLKDTLVVAAALSDIGKNKSDDGASWLIESDTLRLVRISSDLADQTYNTGKSIEIFIEFNKPVHLKAGRSNNPVLNLQVGNGTATAAYKGGQTNLSTKQYFTYTVASGQNTTTANPWLDVTGLNGLAGGNYWTVDNYPFTWEAVSGAGTEEIRITMDASHYSTTTGSLESGSGFLLRRLPVAANTADSMYTLAKGKNIGIDTAPPSVSSIGSTNKAGHYAKDAEIDININFNESVRLANESNPPQIKLKVTNGGNTTVTTIGTPRVNDRTITFSYKVVPDDTTGDNKVIIDSFTGGGITDIAGNNMAAYTFTTANGALNGGTANNGTGIYINTIVPGVPTFMALKSSTNTDTINNNKGTAASGAADIDIKNVYDDQLWFAIIGNTTGGSNRLGYLEYSLDGSNWKRIDNITGTAFQQSVYGQYNVIVRQTDKAGNQSAPSKSVSFNWDPGTLVTRIDSTSANGTYTNTTGNVTPARTDTVNVTVYFRKPITTTGSPTITLNVIRGGNSSINITTAVTADKDQLSFSYAVGNTDNTPLNTYLDVTNFNISATDKDGVNVDNYIKLPADLSNRLGNRKQIKIQTDPLAISSGPAYAFTSADDEATGNITITFNRDISKKDGNISITQQTTGYRLPAVLTETQANRYKSARNFNDYYSRGTNGFVNGAVDTTAKYILKYDETTVVNPNDNGTPQEKMAYDFLTAESVSLPVTSQDITVNGSVLTIKLEGSNALQTLGASYDIVIPAGLIQDGLGFRWPTAETKYTNFKTPGINRPFVRVDKKVDADRITAPGGGGNTKPHLMADYSNLIRTRARLDCRTPDSIVRYKAYGAENTATGTNSTGSNPGSGANQNAAGWNWKNTGADTDDKNNVGQQDTDAGAGTTYTYNTFTGNTTGDAGTTSYTHINVGTTNEQGYVWRIGIKSRDNANSSNNSALYEEIAFRTVLTYEIQNINAGTLGQVIGSGDQLWIRGGDAIGSSSVSGFPINWQDDYGKLNTEKKRAGIRLLRFTNTNTPTNISTGTTWRYITWEINVQTWHDVVLGRGTDTATAQTANDAWQYGPRQWAYQRGGWSAQKDEYTLIPGKHRWVRITNQNYTSGIVNFSLQFSTRVSQTVTYPQP